MPHSIFDMPKLKFLRLENNLLIGNIPTDFGASASLLQDLYLSNNNLSGSIPTAISTLINLDDLSLTDNQLSGNIPQQLADLDTIRLIKLGSNEFVGTIPQVWANMDSILVMKLDSNNLEGCIPPVFLDRCDDMTFSLNLDGNIQLPYSGDTDDICDNSTTLDGSECGDGVGTFDLANCNCNTECEFEVVDTFVFDIAELILFLGTPDLVDNDLTTCNISFSPTSILDSILLTCDMVGDTVETFIWDEFGEDSVSFQLIVTDQDTFTVDSIQFPLSLIETSLSGVTADQFTPSFIETNTSYVSTDLNIFVNQDSCSLIGVTYTDVPSNLTTDSFKIIRTFGVIEWTSSNQWEFNQVIINSPSNNPCTHPDYVALEAFYQSTNGDDWDDNTDWLSNCDPCGLLEGNERWYGLCCDEAINRVRGIDMFGIANCDEDGAIVGSGNDLTGSIPLSINQLTELTFFDIEGSNVTGPIPSTLPDLVNLRYFDISENNMTGPIPNNIGNLQELIFFDLQANSINDTLPNSITEIKTLEFFDLESTGMFGKIPFGFGELNDLYLFDIQFNNFSGKLPDDIGDIDLDFFDILVFYINDNNFSDCIPPSLSNYCDKLGVDVDIKNNPLWPNGGDYWDEFCDEQDPEGQPCGIALDSIIVDCNCVAIEDCPTPICKTDIAEPIFVQEGRKIPLERVLEDGFPVRDCYSFDPVMDVDTFLLVCADVCTIKEVTVYSLTTGESCTTDVYVSQLDGACSEFDPPDITIELIDQGYTGGEFISIDVILDGLIDISEYTFQIRFDTFALEFVEGINLNSELAPKVDFFTTDGPYVRVIKDSNIQSINDVFAPTRVVTLVFRIKNQPFCGETMFDIAPDAFNVFLSCQEFLTAIEATYIPTTVIYNHPLPITNPTLLEVCENEEITVSIINSDDYQSITWEESGSDDLNVAPASTTDYDLSLIDNNGCVIYTFFTITVIECSDCIEGACLFDNPPAFFDLLTDITVSCAEDIPLLENLEYTNNMSDDCLESGSVPPMRDSINFANCQGTIIESWTHATLCGVVIEASRIITVESPGTLVFVDTPIEFIDINCDENEIELYEIELEYAFDGENDCIPMGVASLTTTQDYNECGGTVTYKWSIGHPCSVDSLTFSQIATVSANDSFEFIDPPADITLSCSQLPFEPDTLLITNDTEGACAVSQEVEAGSIEISEGCPGQIIITWAYDNPCTGVQISHKQIVTLVDCAAATLAEDYIEVRAGNIYDINLFDNDLIPDSFSTQIIEIEREELFFAKDYEPNGLFEFAISESFFDTLRVTYEVCNLECDNCTTNTLKIVDEALKDIILTDIITPNDDGQNDALRFNFESEISGAQLYIYNRWGDKIYEKLGYTNDWDASGYPGGIYFYVLQIGDAQIKKTLTVVK
ncbi:MAG: gliding motility-associated-like protein [Saprospiraceae bacterium]